MRIEGADAHLARQAAESQASVTARRILDHFDVRARLEAIRDAVWRGGTIQFCAQRDRGGAGQPRDVYYELAAAWDTAAFDPAPGTALSTQLAVASAAVLEGSWRRAQAAYSLCVGIDAASAPTAIYVRSSIARYLVPYFGCADAQVRRALDTSLEEYARAFLEGHLTVPRAVAAATEKLRRYGL